MERVAITPAPSGELQGDMPDACSKSWVWGMGAGQRWSSTVYSCIVALIAAQFERCQPMSKA